MERLGPEAAAGRYANSQAMTSAIDRIVMTLSAGSDIGCRRTALVWQRANGKSAFITNNASNARCRL